jgi:hypothetical protein
MYDMAKASNAFKCFNLSLFTTAPIWLPSASRLVSLEFFFFDQSEITLLIDALKAKDSNIRHLTVH